MKKAFFAMAAAMALSPLAAQASEADLNAYFDLIEKSGTSISYNDNTFDKNCIGKAGYYAYEKDKEDLLVVCTSQVNENDSEAVWEVVAHESTHIMQVCSQSGFAFKSEYHPRIVRELQRKAPHYSKMIDTTYMGRSQLQETEAFYMELQQPSHVMAAFSKICLGEN